MATVVLTPTALEDVDRLVRTHSLAGDTRSRLARSSRELERFPLLGAALAGRWEGFRFVLGPWRWMIVVYAYLPQDELVAVVTVQDGRSAAAPTAE